MKYVLQLIIDIILVVTLISVMHYLFNENLVTIASIKFD